MSNSRQSLKVSAIPLWSTSTLAVALIAALVFLPGLPGQFLFDDYPNIVNNNSVHLVELNFGAIVDVLSTPQPSGYLRSLPTLTFALDYWRSGGADPAAFRTTNILIHALTALALAWFFRHLLLLSGEGARRSAWTALALALTWAFHPLHVSAVLYVVQRLQTLGTLFLVLALLAYLKGRGAQLRGESGRSGLLAAVLLWVLALCCKEDSILLPAYLLALELSVLRFRSGDSELSMRIRRSYFVGTALAVAAWLLIFVPLYWSSDAYPGRDFNAFERLLTQGRVLCMYLWQIVVPMPSHMPFFYDWIEPSRGVLRPWTTLASWLVLLALALYAWRVRSRKPLFSLGVFVFLAAHGITSNVIGLELAYEHRNHFALVGAVLAIGATLVEVGRWRRFPLWASAIAMASVLALLGCATLLRAHTWRSNVEIARVATISAPKSPRAWIALCDAELKSGGPVTAANPRLDAAIAACVSGAESNPGTLNSTALLVVLKTVRGDIAESDWERFLSRLEAAHMSADNTRAPLIFCHYLAQGILLDRGRVLHALEGVARRAETIRHGTLTYIGGCVLEQLDDPDKAVEYFVRAARLAPLGDPIVPLTVQAMVDIGRPDLADAIMRASRESHGPADTNAGR